MTRELATHINQQKRVAETTQIVSCWPACMLHSQETESNGCAQVYFVEQLMAGSAPSLVQPHRVYGRSLPA